MHIVVLGAGAIGSVYGAKLSTSNDVTLLTRQAHAKAINANGLRITGAEEAIYRLKAATTLDDLPPDALVVLTTKVCDSEAAIRGIAPMIRPDTVILCLQNGLRSEDIVKAVVGDRCLVLRAITDFGAIFDTPGSVELKACSDTSIEQSPKSAMIAEALTRCGLDGRVSDRIKDEVWRKLVVNCVINPINAITRTEVGAIADERLNPLKQLIVDECRRVARCDGVELEDNPVAAINQRYGRSRNLSSMQQDLLKGKQTEIDFLNGAVVRLGSAHGIECPVNQALTAIIKQMERSESGRTRD